MWRFVHPNAKTVIGIDWARIRETPAGVMIREKWIPRGALPGFPALELLDVIDRFLIALPGRSSSPDAPDDSLVAAAGDSGDSPILIAIQGHFDAARVHQLFTRSGAKAQSYNSFQVYRPQNKRSKDTAYVLFDAQTILYGDAPSVFAALDRNQFAPAPAPSTPVPGSLAARASELEAKYELWAIVDTTEALSGDPISAMFGGNEWASASKGVEAGLNLRAGLDADFIVRFSSDAVAKRVTSELTRAVNLAARDKSVDAQTQAIARNLRFTVDGSASRISLRLNEQELEKMAQAFENGQKAAQQAAADAAARANPTPALTPAVAPSKPAMIRIEGLDDGPREIPYPAPGH
jgi:hypothetical protein